MSKVSYIVEFTDGEFVPYKSIQEIEHGTEPSEDGVAGAVVYEARRIGILEIPRVKIVMDKR